MILTARRLGVIVVLLGCLGTTRSFFTGLFLRRRHFANMHPKSGGASTDEDNKYVSVCRPFINVQRFGIQDFF